MNVDPPNIHHIYYININTFFVLKDGPNANLEKRVSFHVGGAEGGVPESVLAGTSKVTSESAMSSHDEGEKGHDEKKKKKR